jgi:hypothetical protein
MMGNFINLVGSNATLINILVISESVSKYAALLVVAAPRQARNPGVQSSFWLKPACLITLIATLFKLSRV